MGFDCNPKCNAARQIAMRSVWLCKSQRISIPGVALSCADKAFWFAPALPRAVSGHACAGHRDFLAELNAKTSVERLGSRALRYQPFIAVAFCNSTHQASGTPHRL